jgi:hypothetical protein
MKWTLEMFIKRLLAVLGIAVVFSLLLFISKMTNLRALLWCITVVALCAYSWYMESNISYRKPLLPKLISLGLFLSGIALATLVCYVCGIVVEYLFDWHAFYWELTALKGFGLCLGFKILYELGKASAWWFNPQQMIYECSMWLFILCFGIITGWALVLFVWPLLPI